MTTFYCKLCSEPMSLSITTTDKYYCSRCPEYTLYHFDKYYSEYLDVGVFVLAAYNGIFALGVYNSDMRISVYRRSKTHLNLHFSKELLTPDLARYWLNRLKTWNLLS